MPPKGTRLRVDRAVGRIRNDTWDDLWPDIASLLDLPNSKAEVSKLRLSVSRLRRGGARPAFVEAVPKADGLTRPGHYLWPAERVYYQGLVDTVLHLIDKRMGGTGNVFGYRALNGPLSAAPFGRPLGRWKAFRQYLKAAARSGRYDAVVKTDIASFFERIQHPRLESQLRALGVTSSVAVEIRQLLTRLVDGQMGLPQGSDPSSVLASAYLEPVDAYMLRKGYTFYRYVDDIYIFAANEAEARRGLRELEGQLRQLQLQLQSGKTEIIVGPSAIKAKVIDADSDVASTAFVYRRAPRGLGLARVKKKWRSVSRRKPFPPRIGKYLLRRLAANRDPLALDWCLRNLGVLDWLTRELGPYLSLFAHKPTVQRRLVAHLRSPLNDSPAEESSILRVLLSASRIDRAALDLARAIYSDKNRSVPIRQWACVLLGRHGDSADHRLILTCYLENEHLARAGAVASRGMDASLGGVILTGVDATFEAQRVLTARLRGLARPSWPVYEV